MPGAGCPGADADERRTPRCTGRPGRSRAAALEPAGGRDGVYLAHTGYSSQQTAQAAEPGRPDNLLHPVDAANGHDYGSHGMFDDRSHDRSPQLWLSQHARISSGLLASAAAAGTFPAARLGHHR